MYIYIYLDFLRFYQLYITCHYESYATRYFNDKKSYFKNIFKTWIFREKTDKWKKQYVQNPLKTL